MLSFLLRKEVKTNHMLAPNLLAPISSQKRPCVSSRTAGPALDSHIGLHPTDLHHDKRVKETVEISVDPACIR